MSLACPQKASYIFLVKFFEFSVRAISDRLGSVELTMDIYIYMVPFYYGKHGLNVIEASFLIQ